MPRPPDSPVLIQELVDALLLFDEPMLNSRFHGLLLRDRAPWRQRLLEGLPALVVRSHQHARLAAQGWTGLRFDARFVARVERALLEAFLSLAESQLRAISFMANSAPAAAPRRSFDEMATIHRRICHDLRAVLQGLASEADFASVRSGVRSVQEEDVGGYLRGQLEEALRERVRRGGVRRIVLSHTAQRHLRDQGLFRGGETTVEGTPVAIDLSWEGPAFAIEGFDVLPLEEIYAERDPSRPQE